MSVTAEPPDSPKPLGGQTVLVLGRIHGLTRRRLDQLVRLMGGKLAQRPNARVTLVALGHSIAANVQPDGHVRLPAGLPETAVMISEQELRRRLGISRPPEAAERNLSRADIERLSNLTPRLISCLTLFDVLEPVDDRYGYRDVVAAREANRLLSRGVDLRRVLEATVRLRRQGSHLAESKLAEGPSGELLRDIAGRLAELNGQLTMGLDQESRSVDDLVAAAEQAEADDDLAAAENLYTTALRADATDPVLPFNLGNVFSGQGRAAEAKIAWQIAVARDPAFAEAWYNLAMAAEDDEHTDLAIAEYRRAIQAWPDYADAHFNLALLLTKVSRFAEALAAWETFLALAPGAEQSVIAKRAAALCRMEIVRQAQKTG